MTNDSDKSDVPLRATEFAQHAYLYSINEALKHKMPIHDALREVALNLCTQCLETRKVLVRTSSLDRVACK